MVVGGLSERRGVTVPGEQAASRMRGGVGTLPAGPAGRYLVVAVLYLVGWLGLDAVAAVF